MSPQRLAGLVTYHSGVSAETELRQLAAELAEFRDEASATLVALAYCEMATGAAGELVTLAERLARVERRYGVGHHVVTRSVRQARPELERCIQRVEASLRSSAAPG